MKKKKQKVKALEIAAKREKELVKMFKALPKTRYGRQIARLNNISSGAGSVIVAPNVKSVELVFKKLNKDGHMGARKFWRENLPRVQFHNPDLPIQVTRVETKKVEEQHKVPAVLKVNFVDGQSKQVDVKHKHSEQILVEFVKLTSATPAPEVVFQQES